MYSVIMVSSIYSKYFINFNYNNMKEQFKPEDVNPQKKSVDQIDEFNQSSNEQEPQFKELLQNLAQELNFEESLDDMAEVTSFLQNAPRLKFREAMNKIVEDDLRKIVMKLIEFGVANPDDIPNGGEKLKDLESALPIGFTLKHQTIEYIKNLPTEFNVIECNGIRFGEVFQKENNLKFRCSPGVGLEEVDFATMSPEAMREFLQDMLFQSSKEIIKGIFEYSDLTEDLQDIPGGFHVATQKWTGDVYVDSADNKIKVKVLTPKNLSPFIIPPDEGQREIEEKIKVK